MTLHVSVSGVNKRVLGIWVGVGGAWKKVLTGHTSVSGAYKKFFSAGDIVNPLAGGTVASIAYNGGDNTASMTLLSTGGITTTKGPYEPVDDVDGTRWFTGEPDQAYQAFATLLGTSGTGSTFGTFGSWVALSGSPSWGCSKLGGVNGARSISLKIKIRRASDGVVVSNDTYAYNLSAAVNTGDPP
jgi:hypothetical protein